MPVASLPDLELVCAPRSSLSTQKYKPKVGGGQITLLSPLAQILGGDAAPVSPVIYATAPSVSATALKGLFIKLMEKRIPVMLLCVIEHWFSIGNTCVKWGT